MSEDEIEQFCPYCGIKLTKPYWQHIQKEHGDKYQKKETWVKLFKDYKGLGMDMDKCILVISELFNASETEVLSFLRSKKVL